MNLNANNKTTSLDNQSDTSNFDVTPPSSPLQTSQSQEPNLELCKSVLFHSDHLFAEAEESNESIASLLTPAEKVLGKWSGRVKAIKKV